MLKDNPPDVVHSEAQEVIEKCLKKFLEKENIEYEVDKKEGVYSLDLVLKSPT